MSYRSLNNSITSIRNAYLAKKKYVLVPESKIISSFCSILQKNGYLGNKLETFNFKMKYKLIYKKKLNKKMNELFAENSELKISKIRKNKSLFIPPFREIKLCTNKIINYSVKDIEMFFSKDISYSFLIFSTNKGILSAKQALDLKIGGRLICILN